jgi:hypothetical protein
MARDPDADLPLPGLYGVQWRLMGFTVLLPLLTYLLPWAGPVRLLGYALPPLCAGVGLLLVFTLKCPACAKRLMIRGVIIFPRRRCTQCRKTVA